MLLPTRKCYKKLTQHLMYKERIRTYAMLGEINSSCPYSCPLSGNWTPFLKTKIRLFIKEKIIEYQNIELKII